MIYINCVLFKFLLQQKASKSKSFCSLTGQTEHDGLHLNNNHSKMPDNKISVILESCLSRRSSFEIKLTFCTSGNTKKRLYSHFVAWQSCQAVFVNLNWMALQHFDPFEIDQHFDGHYGLELLLYWDHLAYCCQLHHASHCYWLLASQYLLHQHI